MHTITKLPKSMIEIAGELSAPEFERYRSRAVKHLALKANIPGFRKGMATEAVLVSKVGEMTLLEEMAELALSELYPALVAKEELDVIGAPEITITKIGKGSALGFKIQSAVIPELTLPNYKKIAKEEMGKDEPTEASDADVASTLEDIRKSRSTEKNEKGEPILPELTDEFATSLGKFSDMEDLKKKLKENISEEKKLRLRDKKRLATLERIAEETKSEVPELLVASESEKMLLRLKSDIERLGLKFEDYLKNVNKTEIEIREGWKGEAHKRAKIELLLMKISEIENIKPTAEEIEKEVHHVLEHQPGAQEERVRDYVASVLSNEKVLQFLENEK